MCKIIMIFLKGSNFMDENKNFIEGEKVEEASSTSL